MSEKTHGLPFDLRSLEIFLAVCEAGAMAAAARELGLTQPAVSLAIAELERKTGTSLFDRTVRPLALTLAGGLMRQRASALIADARQIAPLLRESKHGKVPLIRAGLVDFSNPCPYNSTLYIPCLPRRRSFGVVGFNREAC